MSVFIHSAGGFGSFLLGIYDPDTEQYQAISKIGTGFSEELLKEVSTALQGHIIAQPPRYYRCVCRLSSRQCAGIMHKQIAHGTSKMTKGYARKLSSSWSNIISQVKAVEIVLATPVVL
jgi:hypothetical protein